MRRADRLFDIIQLLRRRRLVRAADLAERLEVSERTIYRDISALVASGVPIEGEAGVGYMLRKGFDLPPLMFTEQEIEALVLGARIVESWGDASLAESATSALAKVETVLPARLKAHVADTPLLAPARHYAEPVRVDVASLRRAVRERRLASFEYRDGDGNATRRTVRPLALAFFGPVWVLASWCELREDFRAFRLDRMDGLEVLPDVFDASPEKSLATYLRRDTERQAHSQ